jgi:hypothetical protein
LYQVGFGGLERSSRRKGRIGRGRQVGRQGWDSGGVFRDNLDCRRKGDR